MEAAVRNTILRIYDAAVDARLWPAVLQHVAGQVGAVGAIVFEWADAEGERNLRPALASDYYDIPAIEEYLSRALPHEVRDQSLFEKASLRSDGIDLIQDDILAPDQASLRALPNVLMLQKLGILHRAAGLLHKDNIDKMRFSLQLGVDRGRLTALEMSFLGQVLPHLAKAMDLGRPAQELARTHGPMLSAMDRLQIGVCVLDAAGRVVARNSEWQRQSDFHDVFRVQRDGTLMMVAPENEALFRALKADVANHGKFGARPRKEAIAADAGHHLCIEVLPLERSEEIGTQPLGGFLVQSIDTGLPRKVDSGPLRRAFGLTATEAELLDAIAYGQTNHQIAQQRERSAGTVNAQVKSILSKTGCANRTQLVRLMTSFGGGFLTPESET